MTEARMNWLLVEDGGVAGFYLASLHHRHPNKAKWMREMLNRFEPTMPLMRQEQQMSADFFLSKHLVLDKFEGADDDFARWAYKCFENWWYNKRRDNQKHYERAVFVATTWEENPATKRAITTTKEEDTIMNIMELKKIWRLLPMLDEREQVLFEVMLGLVVLEWDENGDCLNYPPAYIASHGRWMTGKKDTIRKHKRKLREKIKNFLENYNDELEEAILEELRIEKNRQQLIGGEKNG
tara:strand:- start:38 stop:754 length:717 start_codon:yes stop_codon:yes gene_type:complete